MKHSCAASVQWISSAEVLLRSLPELDCSVPSEQHETAVAAQANRKSGSMPGFIPHCAAKAAVLLTEATCL